VSHDRPTGKHVANDSLLSNSKREFESNPQGKVSREGRARSVLVAEGS
jgi:hypothetical protein